MLPLRDIDLPERLRHRLPPVVTRILIGAGCLLAGLVVRRGLDLITPGAAPFALIFPAVMMATLFAGVRTGVVVGSIALGWAWYFIMPVRRSFTFADAAGPSILLVVAIACVITLAVAHLFRRAVQSAQRERDRQIADRDLFLSEFEHRVKNNFAIVISLLELQRRKSDPATADALGAAVSRVEGIARAHKYLYRGIAHQPGTIEISTYLRELCAALADALSLAHGIDVHCDSDSAPVPRDRAVSIGLIVNELVTNAAKHAFAGRERGRIDVSCRVVPEGLRLVVADDGVGMPPPAQRNDRRGGLGTKLVDAFVRQAEGTVRVDSDDRGTRVEVLLAA